MQALVTFTPHAWDLADVSRKMARFRSLTGVEPQVSIQGIAVDAQGETVFLNSRPHAIEHIRRNRAYVKIDGNETAEPVRFIRIELVVFFAAA